MTGRESGGSKAFRITFRLLYALVLAVILAGCGELFFGRNPNLFLLEQSSSQSFCPVWSPDGSVIYYFAEQDHSILGGGQLRAILPDGSGDRLVLDGIYSTIAISPDGTKLALTAIPPGTSRNFAGVLMLHDVVGQTLDTVTPPEDTVVVSHFARPSGKLYYRLSRTQGFYRIDLSSNRVDTLHQVEPNTSDDGFDVWGDSLLVYSGRIYHLLDGRIDTAPALALKHPQFSPLDPSLVLGVPLNASGYHDDLVIVDWRNSHVTHLDARPYYATDILSPCWSPGGDSIVLAAAHLIPTVPEPDNPPYPDRYDLWVLKR